MTLESPLGSAEARFFEVGERYTFQQNGVTANFVCIGRYGSVGEAKIMHPSLGTEKKWYTVDSPDGWTAG